MTNNTQQDKNGDYLEKLMCWDDKKHQVQINNIY